MKIVGIVGSIFGSKTKKVLSEITFVDNVDYEIIDLSEVQLDFADGRDYREYNTETATLVEKILSADALIIGSPIYQASIPGALKNVFDLLPKQAIKDIPVGIVMTAGSYNHFLVPEYQLKPILAYMEADIIEKYVFIGPNSFEQSELVDDDIFFRLENLAERLVVRTKSKQAEYKERFDF